MLKICSDKNEAKNQFNTLREYNGKCFCKTYNADIENGVLLIERIDYENILRCVDDLDERLSIFCELFRGLHIKPADKSLYPTYLDWVDPKGVIGDSVFDIPRFILNEFDNSITNESYNKITYIIKTLSIKLEVDESDIRRLLYVETSMAYCWCVEDGMTPNMDKVLFAEKLLQEVY